MGIWSDFKAFAVKGNVVDLAVGIIIGGAFGKIVTALVNDIIMPLVGLIEPGKKFADHFIILSGGKTGGDYKTFEEAKTAGANVLAYGDFIQTVVDFSIIAFSIFMMIRVVNKLRIKHEEQQVAKPAAPSSTDVLLTEIRDLLKKQ